MHEVFKALLMSALLVYDTVSHTTRIQCSLLTHKLSLVCKARIRYMPPQSGVRSCAPSTVSSSLSSPVFGGALGSWTSDMNNSASVTKPAASTKIA